MTPAHMMFAASEPDEGAVREAVAAAVAHVVSHGHAPVLGWVEAVVLDPDDCDDLRAAYPDLDLWTRLPVGWVVIAVGFFAPPGAARPDLN